MIVRILGGSSSFQAIIYNELKVMNGDAELIIKNNFGCFDLFSDFSFTRNHKEYLLEWSNRNSRIKDAQFHVSISAPGKDIYSKEDLVNIGREWLEKMGYSKNPFLIYFHKDTNNNHIHIVTSRVDENGKKIDHSFEKVRAVKELNVIMNKNVKHQARKDLGQCLMYHFSSLPQLQTLLALRGYQSWQRNDIFYMRKGGEIVSATNLELINYRLKKYREQGEDGKRKKEIQAYIYKYKDQLTEDDFYMLLKNKFGLEFKFYKKNNIKVAYSIIDHNKKKIYSGKSIFNLNKLVFNTQNEIIDSAKVIVNELFISDQFTTFETNKALKKYKLYIKDNKIYNTIQTDPLFKLSDAQKNILFINNKIEFVNKFSPNTRQEAEILANIFNVDVDRISISEENRELDNDYYKNIIKFSCDKFGIFKPGYYDLNLIKHGDDIYIVDIPNRTLFNIADYEIELPLQESYENTFRLMDRGEEIEFPSAEMFTSLLDIFDNPNMGEIEGVGDSSLKRRKRRR